MRLSDYWGVGPKTRAVLEESIGAEAAITAIEGADVGTLVDAGLSAGRATRICRRARPNADLSVLATGDVRTVYRAVLSLIVDHAVTDETADRIRVLAPLTSTDAMRERLDRIDAIREAWEAQPAATREAALASFAEYDEAGGGELAAVRTALDLRDIGLTDGPFASLAAFDADRLRETEVALAGLDEGRVREGVDERLDEYRAEVAAVEDLAADPAGIVADLRESGVRDSDDFREALVEHVVGETGVEYVAVREAAPADAIDATSFVDGLLRTLVSERRTIAEERAADVADGLRATVNEARSDVDAAVEAVRDVALFLSLARFATAYDLTRPRIVDDRDAVAVAGARSLSLSAAGEDVQPVTYALGEHGLDDDGTWTVAPSGDRVTVLTGANSGGKTTLLETLCETVLLAHMGVPVPAERAEVSPLDAIVFHRRHASFNAGVLESTLRTIVPPLVEGGRTLMLVDEFEAITEPGSAADLLHGLVTLSVDREALGAFVTHLAEDLEPLPDAARVDGIFAEGLDENLELAVDYQPRFGTLGRSTPEFIVSRLVAEAGDREVRVGFEALAEAVGEEAVQRTLADVPET